MKFLVGPEKLSSEGSPEALNGSNPIFAAPVSKMTPEERVNAHAILNFLSKRIDERLAELREPILEDARARGRDVTAKDGKPTGSKKLNLNGAEVQARRTVGKEPDPTKMYALLTERGLTVDQAYDLKKNYVYNPSKVERLVENGFLTAAEIDVLKKITNVLVVEGSKELMELLEERTSRSLP